MRVEKYFSNIWKTSFVCPSPTSFSKQVISSKSSRYLITVTTVCCCTYCVQASLAFPWSILSHIWLSSVFFPKSVRPRSDQFAPIALSCSTGVSYQGWVLNSISVSDMTPLLPVWAMKLNKDSGQQVCLAVIQSLAWGAENWGFLPLHVLRVSEMWQALWTEESGALLLLSNDCSYGFIEFFWTCTSLVNIGSYQRLGWGLIGGGGCTAHDRPLSNKCQCVIQILWILVMTAPPHLPYTHY